jgi:hypothetical protein
LVVVEDKNSGMLKISRSKAPHSNAQGFGMTRFASALDDPTILPSDESYHSFLETIDFNFHYTLFVLSQVKSLDALFEAHTLDVSKSHNTHILQIVTIIKKTLRKRIEATEPLRIDIASPKPFHLRWSSRRTSKFITSHASDLCATSIFHYYPTNFCGSTFPL